MLFVSLGFLYVLSRSFINLDCNIHPCLSLVIAAQNAICVDSNISRLGFVSNPPSGQSDFEAEQCG